MKRVAAVIGDKLPEHYVLVLVTVLRVVGRILTIVAYACGGVSAALIFLRTITSSPEDPPSWSRVTLLLLAAAAALATSVGVRVLAETLEEHYTYQRTTKSRPLSEREREAEKLLERPRLAREAGPALSEIEEAQRQREL